MAGVIYCFNTLADENVYKAGQTQNCLRERLRGYIGPSRPRCMIFTRRVDDVRHAEKIMLTLMRQCVSLTQRLDLGSEWFSAVGSHAETRQRHLWTIADISCLASREGVTPRPPSSEAGCATFGTHGGTALRGMERYFTAFDSFVGTYKELHNVSDCADLVRRFEESTHCPVFVKYVPYGPGERTDAARRRYTHLFRCE